MIRSQKCVYCLARWNLIELTNELSARLMQNFYSTVKLLTQTQWQRCSFDVNGCYKLTLRLLLYVKWKKILSPPSLWFTHWQCCDLPSDWIIFGRFILKVFKVSIGFIESILLCLHIFSRKSIYSAVLTHKMKCGLDRRFSQSNKLHSRTV